MSYINKDYWEKFYENFSVSNESHFANYVNNKIPPKSKIIDIACGNGRDTLFFEKQNHNVIGMDNVNQQNFLGKNFLKMDALNFKLKADVFYCRFFVHTISENNLDKFILNMKDIIENGMLFIETRSTTGYSENEKIKTFFKSSIGEEHFRMLYSKEYLRKKFSREFEIIECIESNKFAEFKGESPFVLRFVLKGRN